MVSNVMGTPVGELMPKDAKRFGMAKTTFYRAKGEVVESNIPTNSTLINSQPQSITATTTVPQLSAAKPTTKPSPSSFEIAYHNYLRILEDGALNEDDIEGFAYLMQVDQSTVVDCVVEYYKAMGAIVDAATEQKVRNKLGGN